MKHVTTFLVTLFLVLTCTGCNEEETIIGSWEGTMAVSILGAGVEESETTDSVIRFVFAEDGTGTMETFHILPLAELPTPGLLTYTYTTDADQLTLALDNGQTMVFTYHLDGDTLALDGRADLTLTRTK